MINLYCSYANGMWPVLHALPCVYEALHTCVILRDRHSCTAGALLLSDSDERLRLYRRTAFCKARSSTSSCGLSDMQLEDCGGWFVRVLCQRVVCACMQGQVLCTKRHLRAWARGRTSTLTRARDQRFHTWAPLEIVISTTFDQQSCTV
jgi:hypothetical protein